MEKRPTIKDIASQAGVSMGTVHLVLRDKPGASEETRAKVREVALKLGYRPNYVAAGLKRKTLRIAAVLPVNSSDNRYYFSYQWSGITDCVFDMMDFNVELISAPYNGGLFAPADLIYSLLEKEKPDGIICEGFIEARTAAALKKLEQEKIPVALLGADMPETGRLFCVMPPYETIGEMTAELLVRMTESGKRILVGCGEAGIPSHQLTLRGMESFIAENNVGERFEFIPTGHLIESNIDSFAKRLTGGDFGGCCAVSARDSIALAAALEKAGLSGRLTAFGSDLFPENAERLRRGVFSLIMQKNPYQQGYLAAQYIIEYLLQAKRPPAEVVKPGCEPVLKSNLPLYDNGFYRLLY